jgi:AraC-like DNA-binding protein
MTQCDSASALDRLPQGKLTSASLRQALLEVTRERYPDLESVTDDKTALLRAVGHRDGAAGVVAVGRSALRRVPPSPVWAAIETAPSGGDVLARWRRLERFGHTRHRTRRLCEDTSSVVLEHYALDGGPVEALHDLFIWGALVGLLERSGFRDVGLALGDGRVLLPAADVPSASSVALQETHRATLTWSGRMGAPVPSAPIETHAAASSGEPPRTPASERVSAVIQRDLLRTWRLQEIARALGTSTRTLQRELADEGTRFSELAHRTRLVAAQRLLTEGALPLTEVAFATGFSDLAHLSRSFRRHFEVPPSAYVDLMRESRVSGGARSARTGR